MKKKFLIMIALIATICTISQTAFAATPYAPYRLIRGVSKMYYYVDSTASQYIPKINNAADNWIVTGYGVNPIYIYPVSSNYGTEIDFYGVNGYAQWGSYDGNYVLGETFFFLSNGTNLGGRFNGNWYYTEIKLNNNVLPNSAYDAQKGTITHEMGHSFGLSHTDNRYSIMCQTKDGPNGIYGRITQSVGIDDHNAINEMY